MSSTHSLSPLTLCVLGVSLVACTIGSQTKTSLPPGWTVALVLPGIYISSPPEWTKEKPEEDTILWDAPKDEATITLTVQTAKASTTLESYTAHYLKNIGDQLKSQGITFGLGSSIDTHMGNLPAHQIDFTLASEKKIHALSVWAVHGGKVISLTFSPEPGAFDSYRPTFEQMVESVVVE